MNNIKTLKNSLEIFFNKNGKEKPQNFIEINKAWEIKIEKKIRKRVKIIEIENNSLILKTENPVARNEILLRKKEILSIINKETKIKNNLKDIIIK